MSTPPTPNHNTYGLEAGERFVRLVVAQVVAQLTEPLLEGGASAVLALRKGDVPVNGGTACQMYPTYLLFW